MNKEQIEQAIINQLEDGFEGANEVVGLNDKQYLPAFYLMSYSSMIHKLRENKKERDRVSVKAYSETKFYERITDQCGVLKTERKRSFEEGSPLWNLFKAEIVGLEDEIVNIKAELDRLEDEIITLNEVYRGLLDDATDLAKICLDRSYMEEEQFRTGVRFNQ